MNHCLTYIHRHGTLSNDVIVSTAALWMNWSCWRNRGETETYRHSSMSQKSKVIHFSLAHFVINVLSDSQFQFQNLPATITVIGCSLPYKRANLSVEWLYPIFLLASSFFASLVQREILSPFVRMLTTEPQMMSPQSNCSPTMANSYSK